MDARARGLEFWTWLLVAEIAKVLPIERVIEAHAGGGQYDSIDLHLVADRTNTDSQTPQIACNRVGSIHVMFAGEHHARQLFSDLAHGLPLEDAVNWITRHAPTGGTPDPVVASSLGFMSEVLSECMGRTEESWEWRNGYLDTSGGFSSRRQDHFAAVAGAAEACTRQSGDLLGLPEYRFWFLLRNGSAQVAVEPSTGSFFVDGGKFPVDDESARSRCMNQVFGDSAFCEEAQTPAERVAAARQAFLPVAKRLAAELTEDVQEFDPVPHKLTQLAVWYSADADATLMVVTGRHESVDSLDHVLAYALAWQGDRDLVLVVPE